MEALLDFYQSSKVPNGPQGDVVCNNSASISISDNKSLNGLKTGQTK